MADTIRKTLIEYADNRAELYKYEADGLSTKANLDHALAEIKRIVEEAKPNIPYKKNERCLACGDYQYDHAPDEHFEYATDQYHTNLMKALGESIDK